MITSNSAAKTVCLIKSTGLLTIFCSLNLMHFWKTCQYDSKCSIHGTPVSSVGISRTDCASHSAKRHIFNANVAQTWTSTEEMVDLIGILGFDSEIEWKDCFETSKDGKHHWSPATKLRCVSPWDPRNRSWAPRQERNFQLMAPFGDGWVWVQQSLQTRRCSLSSSQLKNCSWTLLILTNELQVTFWHHPRHLQLIVTVPLYSYTGRRSVESAKTRQTRCKLLSPSIVTTTVCHRSPGDWMKVLMVAVSRSWGKPTCVAEGQEGANVELLTAKFRCLLRELFGVKSVSILVIVSRSLCTYISDISPCIIISNISAALPSFSR